MRFLGFVVASLIVVGSSLSAQAEPSDTTLNFAVVRNGDRIGNSSVRILRNGDEMVAESTTHVQVKVAFVTVYRFDQRATEHWAGGRLVAMTAVTDDNGAPHRVVAKSQGKTLTVDADGKTSEIDGAVIPASLWNPSLAGRTAALNPQDGTLVPVSVVDHGEERVVIQGRAMAAHHYSIKTNFPQDVWFDERQQLVKLELRGSDGSKIHYQPG